MQTILGTNGVIGRALSHELSCYTERIRQVSRVPKLAHPTDELFSADLLDSKATADASPSCLRPGWRCSVDKGISRGVETVDRSKAIDLSQNRGDT